MLGTSKIEPLGTLIIGTANTTRSPSGISLENRVAVGCTVHVHVDRMVYCTCTTILPVRYGAGWRNLSSPPCFVGLPWASSPSLSLEARASSQRSPFGLKCLDFVLKMFDFVLKMLDFAGSTSLRSQRPPWKAQRGGRLRVIRSSYGSAMTLRTAPEKNVDAAASLLRGKESCCASSVFFFFFFFFFVVFFFWCPFGGLVAAVAIPS